MSIIGLIPKEKNNLGVHSAGLSMHMKFLYAVCTGNWVLVQTLNARKKRYFLLSKVKATV